MSSQADLSDFDGFVQLLELDAQTLVVKGQASLIEKQRLIDQILENSFVVQLGQGKFGQCLVSSVSSCLRILELTYYIYIYIYTHSYYYHIIKNLISYFLALQNAKWCAVNL